MPKSPYPGHMVRAERMIRQHLKTINVVVGLLDARIPRSSRDPRWEDLFADKETIFVLNKSDLAEPVKTGAWRAHLQKKGHFCLETNLSSGRGIPELKSEIEKLHHQRSVRLMVVGIPNVGKSSLINRLSGRSRARVEDRAGVTRGKQWIRLASGWRLLDMPGVLWPEPEDEQHFFRLAVTGALRRRDYDPEEIAYNLLGLIVERKGTDFIREHYELDDGGLSRNSWEFGDQLYDLLIALGRRRGFLRSGGEVDCMRAGQVLIADFQEGKLGRYTIEDPPASR